MELNNESMLKIVLPEATKDQERVMYQLPIYSVQEFINITKANPSDYIQYCEIVVLEDGRIIKAQPSHTAVIHSIVRYKTAGTDFEFSVPYYEEELFCYSKAISIWYKLQKCYSLKSLTEPQLLTMELLADAGLIQKNLVELDRLVREHFEAFNT